MSDGWWCKDIKNNTFPQDYARFFAAIAVILNLGYCLFAKSAGADFAGCRLWGNRNGGKPFPQPSEPRHR